MTQTRFDEVGHVPAKAGHAAPAPAETRRSGAVGGRERDGARLFPLCPVRLGGVWGEQRGRRRGRAKMNERHRHERHHRGADAGTPPRPGDWQSGAERRSGASWLVSECVSQPWLCHKNWILCWQYSRMAISFFPDRWPLEELQPCVTKKDIFSRRLHWMSNFY